MQPRTFTFCRQRAGLVVGLVLAGLMAVSATPVRADDAKKPAKKEAKKKPDFPPFDEVTKDCTLIDGFFPLYFNAKTDRLLAVIPANLIGTDFLMARSVNSGGRLTGYQFGHALVRWERFKKKMMLVEPELRHLRDKKSPVRDVIDRTYTDSVVLATPIVTLRGGDPVIDLDAIFKRNPDGNTRVFGGSLDASLSKWVKKKAFADNLELAVEGVFMGRNGGTKATLHYSISRLPKNGYEPREADDRIGYFMTARKDWTTPHDAPTTFKRYIHRWWLRKAEPDQAVSDVHPNDQIVFYIEKTVPVKFRRYIREGILLWNSAFEKAGIRNAIAVRQQTDSNEFAGLDPEDVNYNFFRWIVSGRAFAMGPSRANPLTGQILDADIIMDDSMARVWYDRYDRMMAQGPAGDDAQLSAFLDAHPEWRFQSSFDKLLPGFDAPEAALPAFEPETSRWLKQIQPHANCSYANGVAHEMCLGAALLDASPNPGVTRDEFVGQWLKLVACHEVGHTLGLRHNFKASAWLPLSAIIANDNPDVPTTASVMDYNPAVYNVDRSPRKLYLSQAVGPYDDLAIAYGYRLPTKGEKEADMLAEIAASLAEQGLHYATDDNRSFFDPDPLVNVYDHSRDPVEWAAYRMDLADSLRKDLADWAIQDGESYHRLRRAFDMLLFEYTRVTRFAARVIGGQYLTRDHRDDPNARTPIEIVPLKTQQAALDFLNQRVFSEKAFQFDPALLNQLAPGRWSHWGTTEYDPQEDYPLHDRIAAVQYWALFHVTNPVTLRRVHDAELKVPADQPAMTLADLLAGVTATIWSELTGDVGQKQFTGRDPFIASVRRDLQRKHLAMLTRIVLAPADGAYPPDAIAIARMQMTDLKASIARCQENSGLDAASRAHLADSSARIEKALDAGYEF
jgi:hypothetical protein